MAGPIAVRAHVQGSHFVRASTRARTLMGAGYNGGAMRGSRVVGYGSKYIVANRGGTATTIARFGGDLRGVTILKKSAGATRSIRLYASPTKSSLGRLSRLHWTHAPQAGDAAGRAEQIARTRRIYGRFGG